MKRYLLGIMQLTWRNHLIAIYDAMATAAAVLLARAFSAKHRLTYYDSTI